LGRRLSKLASEYTHWVRNGNVPLREWSSGREWKDDDRQHYELDLRTWVFEEESFAPNGNSFPPPPSPIHHLGPSALRTA